ncbi:hypothetical protein ACIBF1_18750 [Spirillospora sp. NPDC050679]
MTTLQEIAQMVYRVHAQYCAAHDIRPSPDWYVLKLQEEVGEVSAAHLAADGRHRHEGRPDAVAFELADVVCFSILVAREHGIDLDAAIRDKWAVYDRPETAANGSAADERL